MKRKHRRLTFVAIGLLALGAATALVLSAFDENIVFFFSPSELSQKQITPDQRLRVGGLVEEGSVTKAADGVTILFKVTDTAVSLPVEFKGILPDLFREGQGVVTEGRLVDGVFRADEVLAKHDENYMPPEFADALKDAGHWEEKMTESAKKGGLVKETPQK